VNTRFRTHINRSIQFLVLELGIAVQLSRAGKIAESIARTQSRFIYFVIMRPWKIEGTF
jgi:hypothetical protein